ncbi:MAG TPA: DNA-directed RNA polymerase subunit alpha C-terminal domain-containing protein [Pirellulaceae bacterium]|nr:DNA-directed RNA polymerase subunit alpha C-terminal domain-containing protein [Pirellulaceae bacterium]
MSQALAADLREIVLANSTFGPQEITQLARAISDDPAQFSLLRDAVGELEVREDRTPASAVRLGVCYYLMGRYRQAIETLSSADGGALAHFYLGRSQFALNNFAAAIVGYKAAKVAGYNGDDCALAICEALRYDRKPTEALAVLDALSGPIESTAEYLYQRGATVAAIGGNPLEVIALYERAVETQGNHAGALFGLALENDRRGNDERALQLYSRSTAMFPPNLGSLMNLGILYEDRNQFDKAQQCYHRILEVFPDHPQARLFLKDASASGDMFYDEEAERRHDRLSHVLNIPVSDFELSVRSRNCLQKMGVRTLGDLCRTTEQELLASKNFGETSLVEIRDMLASKGLELGQFAFEKAPAEPVYEAGNMSPDEQALLDRPIADLNLSVRARKCMVRLGMTTLADLVRKTQDDLLECKNFGVTSLNEVREKLTELGLKLRGE